LKDEIERVKIVLDEAKEGNRLLLLEMEKQEL